LPPYGEVILQSLLLEQSPSSFSFLSGKKENEPKEKSRFLLLFDGSSPRKLTARSGEISKLGLTPFGLKHLKFPPPLA